MGAWIPAVITALIQLGVAIFVYGRLVERVDGHTRELSILRDKSDDHHRAIAELQTKQADHERRIGKLEN